MTGAEHYAEAERLLDRAAEETEDTTVQALILAGAQVHATLAVAARGDDRPPLLHVMQPPTTGGGSGGAVGAPDSGVTSTAIGYGAMSW